MSKAHPLPPIISKPRVMNTPFHTDLEGNPGQYFRSTYRDTFKKHSDEQLMKDVLETRKLRLATLKQQSHSALESADWGKKKPRRHKLLRPMEGASHHPHHDMVQL